MSTVFLSELTVFLNPPITISWPIQPPSRISTYPFENFFIFLFEIFALREEKPPSYLGLCRFLISLLGSWFCPLHDAWSFGWWYIGAAPNAYAVTRGSFKIRWTTIGKCLYGTRPFLFSLLIAAVFYIDSDKCVAPPARPKGITAPADPNEWYDGFFNLVTDL